MPTVNRSTTTPLGYTIVTIQNMVNTMITNMSNGKPIQATDVANLINVYNAFVAHYHTSTDLRGIDTFGNLATYGASGTYVTATSTVPSYLAPSSISTYSVSAQDTAPAGVAFSTTGTKMFVLGRQTGAVYEYTLSVAWNVTSASYSTSKSVSAQDTIPRGIAFSSDGTKMFMIGSNGNAVYRYNLATAWLVSSATYASQFSVSAQDVEPTDIFFDSTGTIMMVSGDGNDSVYKYTLSSAWDITTAVFVSSYAGVGSVVISQDTVPTGLAFSNDGLKMFIVGDTNNTVHRYSLTSAWNVSTSYGIPSATYDNISLLVSAQETAPTGIRFKSDGLTLYVSGEQTGEINQYNLAVPWDISSLGVEFLPAASLPGGIVANQEVTAAQINAIISLINGARIHSHTLTDAAA